MAASWLLGEPVVQRWVPLEEVSPQLVGAVIASEDARFCSHMGFDVEAITLSDGPAVRWLRAAGVKTHVVED